MGVAGVSHTEGSGPEKGAHPSDSKGLHRPGWGAGAQPGV